MKTKTINRVIRKKMDEWLATIPDENLRTLFKENAVVTGGCIASMLLKESVNDFDIYFRTFEAAKKAADYYLARFMKIHQPPSGIEIPIEVQVRDNGSEKRVYIYIKSAGVVSAIKKGEYRYFEADPDGRGADEFLDALEGSNVGDEEKGSYDPLWLSNNAITLKDKVQVVIRFWGDPAVIHETYDFVHCTNYWTYADGIVLNAKALESLLTKELVYMGSHYPICSVIRTRKFLARGWTCHAGQLLKMAMQISRLDMSDISVLQEQLTGVDSAFFNELIRHLRDWQGENPGKPIDEMYVTQLIDKIF